MKFKPVDDSERGVVRNKTFNTEWDKVRELLAQDMTVEVSGVPQQTVRAALWRRGMRLHMRRKDKNTWIIWRKED